MRYLGVVWSNPFSAPMSPLTLLPSLVVLLLCCSPLVIASIFEPTLSQAACGDDQVAILDASDGLLNLSVNGVLVPDRVLGCKKLRSYFRNGCLHCSELSDAWRGVVKQYCGQGSESSYEKEDHLLAVPGVILLCCGFMLPCFHAERKEASRHNTATIQRNAVESVSSFEVSTSSEKVPPTPHRIPPSPSRFAPSPHIARVGSMSLSIQQILRATQNFSPSFKLGEGGFGMVYRAVLPDGNVVAVKRAKKDQFAGPRDEFSNEVDLLAKIDHRNLVRLLGFTDKGNERIIITEYVPNGTLREHLDGQHGRVLDFNQRLEIAIDVAHALTYLHLYAEKTIIHRDVKSSNILLTDSYRAKVSDFGFARSGPSDTEKTHISTKVKGTAGYLDPEYLRTYQLTPKSDVFSFGILLVEIISARRPVELKRTPEERITIRWTFKKFNEGNTREILDPLLEDHVDDEVLEKLLSLAFQCAAPTREDRPTMKEVGEQLWEIRKEYGKSIRKV
ncbi:calmodulin-binding receptor-like cytoplasmic kinase 3 isoform X2 [Phragmites australis]|uniref:calmodulin-binding receptor-like cytoplasmic kinase 3 isoform X2 n=1 Tax=Phragmites australis TaxID=29695 RepID=UPI002D77436A|nr:calmodulin-binding receptor-like cytoplasmic kinase 3 isoform X2 [Phragmites australis]